MIENLSQVTSRLQEGDFAAFPELTIVAQLLAGQEEALHQAAERCETWWVGISYFGRTYAGTGINEDFIKI